MNKSLSVREILGTSWSLLKQNAGFFIQLIVLVFGSIFGIGLLMGFLTALDLGVVAPFVVMLIAIIISTIMMPGYVKATLDIVDGKSPSISILFSQASSAIPVLVGSFFFGLMVFAGTLLFIIPGIYLALAGMFYIYFMVDRQLSAMDAIKASREMTAGRLISLLKVMLTFIVLSIIPIVGPFISILLSPMQMIAYALIYRRWTGGTETVADNTEGQPPAQPVDPHGVNKPLAATPDQIATTPPPNPTILKSSVVELENITPEISPAPEPIPELENITPANNPETLSQTTPKEIAQVPPPAPGVMQTKVEPGS